MYVVILDLFDTYWLSRCKDPNMLLGCANRNTHTFRVFCMYIPDSEGQLAGCAPLC